MPDRLADLETTVDEITTGVAIALGERRAEVACAAAPRVSYNVTTLVQAITAALHGCPAVLGEPASAIFDATVDGGRIVVAEAREFTAFGPPRRWVSVSLGAQSSVSAGLPLGANAGEILDAAYGFTDYLIPIRGTFARDATAERETISLQLDNDHPREPIPREIILTRPLAPQPQRFGGDYWIRLSGDPMDRQVGLTGAARLLMNSRGFGLLTETALFDDAGAKRGRLGSARCIVGHGGSIACSGKYFVESRVEVDGAWQSAVGRVEVFHMTGRPAGEDPRFSGGYAVGTYPLSELYISGHWSAERRQDGPASTPTD